MTYDGFQTGDDIVVETVVMCMVITILTCTPAYREVIPLPTWLTCALTVVCGFSLVLISRGRAFWALIGAVAWLVMKLVGIKDDVKVWEFFYDEEGRPHLVEKKKEAEA